MMTANTEQLQKEIDRTQRDIHEDLTALQDKLDPGLAVKRSTARISDRFRRAKDGFMGVAEEKATDVESAAADVPHKVTRGTRRNPAAVGLAAFAVGAAIGAIIPPTKMEQERTAALREKVSEVTEPLADAARTVAEEASDAARTVAAQAREGASSVVDTGREQAL